ncbi:putative uncharacterized protein [Acetobacter sp. CAG:977]|nr:putative uncharacterized protein [Acetobacter sp. CAG:977]DAI30914.1 MAG TPA: hypothetical protein [Caudoviricetes sp.]
MGKLFNALTRRDKARKAVELVRAYKAVFQTAEGKTVLKDLAVKCRLMEPVTDVSSAAGFSAASAFFDGKRAAFLDIVKMSGFDEERLTELLLQTEGNKDEFYEL